MDREIVFKKNKADLDVCHLTLNNLNEAYGSSWSCQLFIIQNKGNNFHIEQGFL